MPSKSWFRKCHCKPLHQFASVLGPLALSHGTHADQPGVSNHQSAAPLLDAQQTQLSFRVWPCQFRKKVSFLSGACRQRQLGSGLSESSCCRHCHSPGGGGGLICLFQVMSILITNLKLHTHTHTRAHTNLLASRDFLLTRTALTLTSALVGDLHRGRNYLFIYYYYFFFGDLNLAQFAGNELIVSTRVASNEYRTTRHSSQNSKCSTERCVPKCCTPGKRAVSRRECLSENLGTVFCAISAKQLKKFEAILSASGPELQRQTQLSAADVNALQEAAAKATPKLPSVTGERISCENFHLHVWPQRKRPQAARFDLNERFVSGENLCFQLCRCQKGNVLWN